MNTNETPYRPQVGDRVKVLACGSAAFEVIEVRNDGYTLNCSMGEYCLDELKLISRADGVPVEKDNATVGIDSVSERGILNLVNRWCQESLSPHDFEHWEEVVKGLTISRRGLSELVAPRPEESTVIPCLAADAKVDLQKENDELRKELVEAVDIIHNAFQGFSITQVPSDYGPQHWSMLASAFLVRHQPPSAVDTQQVNHE